MTIKELVEILQDCITDNNANKDMQVRDGNGAPIKEINILNFEYLQIQFEE